MDRRTRRWLAAGTAVVATLLVGVAPPPEVGSAMVAADHPLASKAGAEVLRAGGNAVDAAVAAALSAGVVNPAGSGLGGGGFAVVSDGTTHATWDFREVAPSASDRDMFAVDGVVDRKASRVGGGAVAVPGESRGLARLIDERGKLPARAVAAPAIRQAQEGFVVLAHLAHALENTSHAAVRRLFQVGGRLAGDGDRVRRPDLARTLRAWARSEGEDLHTGAGALAIAQTVMEQGGRLGRDDLAAYTPVERAPILGRFQGYELVTMGPPSSGGVVLAQALAVLEDTDLRSLGHNSSAYIHVVTEAMKHGYADRAHHMGDPGFVDVPTERLLSEERIEAIQKSIWPGRTLPPEAYGPLIAPPRDAGTQHIAAVDDDGLGVALTTTINTSFGSGVVDRSTGVILNNEMDDFAAAPGVPNAYGLVGGEANAIAPGKRPLSSMTPTLVLGPDGEVVMSVGASGGSTIISAVLQAFLNVAVFEMDPQEAVAAPRFHHQWQPDVLFLEPGFPLDVHRALQARGHTLEERPGFSSVQMVVKTAAERMEGGADPRKGGWPARR